MSLATALASTSLDDAAKPFDAVPDEVLAEILAHLGIVDRARSEAVCSSWRAASTSAHAARVWSSLCFPEEWILPDERLGGFMRWLARRAPHVRSLDLDVCVLWRDRLSGPYHSQLEVISNMVLCHGRLRRLRCKSASDDMRHYQLQPAMVAGLAMGTALQALSLDVPENCGAAVVEEAFRSLNKSLKVADIQVEWANVTPAAAQRLIAALCGGPLLQELGFTAVDGSLHMGELPDMSAAPNLTALHFEQLGIAHIRSAVQTFPPGLRRLRLMQPLDGDSGPLQMLPRDFAQLTALSQLHADIADWGCHSLPTSLRTLRLDCGEGSCAGATPQQHAAVEGLSALAALEWLHLSNCAWIGYALPQLNNAVAAMPSLRGLALEGCQLRGLAAVPELGRITYLSLRRNHLYDLSIAAPRGAMSRLLAFDVAKNKALTSNDELLTAENVAAAREYTALRVLSIPEETTSATSHADKVHLAASVATQLDGPTIVCGRIATIGEDGWMLKAAQEATEIDDIADDTRMYWDR